MLTNSQFQAGRQVNQGRMVQFAAEVYDKTMVGSTRQIKLGNSMATTLPSTSGFYLLLVELRSYINVKLYSSDS